MATRTKMEECWFEHLATAADATATTLTQRTIYLPESSKVFRKVVVHVFVHDANTTLANVTQRNLEIQLGAAGFSAVNNVQTLTQTGENFCHSFSGDFTSYFTTNWSGSSMTCDCRLTINTGVLGSRNISVRMRITYEYDDTSAVQIKTAWIALNAPLSALAASKPGTATDTIPILDNFLPEAGKVYRNFAIVIQGNTESSSSTDIGLSYEIDTLGVFTSQLYEKGSSVDLWYRLADVPASFTTSATHSFYIWASTTDFDHPQVYLVVNYEFEADNTTTTLTEDLDASETGVDVTAAANLGTPPFVVVVDTEHMLCTSVSVNTLTVTRGVNGSTAATHANGATVRPAVLCSLQIPATLLGNFGGTTSADYQRADVTFPIQELAPQSVRQAAFVFYRSSAAIAGLNARMGASSFAAYSSAVGGATSGGQGFMVRDDAAHTLVRGNNTINCDVYRTDTVDMGWGSSALFLIDYVAAQPTAGPGAANHTVGWNLYVLGLNTASTEAIIAATSPIIPETEYHVWGVGLELIYTKHLTGSEAGLHVGIERLTGEGGHAWETGLILVGGSASEAGVFTSYSHLPSALQLTRWAGDPAPSRLPLETDRRWRISAGINASSGVAIFPYLDLLINYHTITYTVADSVTNDTPGGTVNLTLRRTSDGEKLRTTSRSGNGAYSFTWFDNTANVFVDGVDASDPSNYKGRSADGLATGTP